MLKHKKLGVTDIKVSPLGLGTVKLGRNQQVKYPNPFVIPSDAEVADLLALAKSLQVNLLDTAPAYGNSEERLGKLLQGQRQDWVIATKVGEEFVSGESQFDFSAKHINFSVERSLQRLRTDYLDIVLVHSSGEDLQIINNYEVFLTLEKLKQRGLIRAFGMSTKTVAGGLATVEHADVAMVTYNLVQQEEEPVLARAKELGKGVFIKKAFASGHLDRFRGNDNATTTTSESLAEGKIDPAKAALEFIFKQQAVSSVIIGTINPEHFRKNVENCSNLKL